MLKVFLLNSDNPTPPYSEEVTLLFVIKILVRYYNSSVKAVEVTLLVNNGANQFQCLNEEHPNQCEERTSTTVIT